jgi:hypothetical protein
MNQERVFTPWNIEGSGRHRMKLSDADWQKVGRGRWDAVVTDLNTNERYAVRGVPCSLKCHCDAEVTQNLGQAA